MTPARSTRPGARSRIRRLGLASACAAALLVAWPASMPWPASAPGPDARPPMRAEATAGTWLPTAAAQSRRRRRKAPAKPAKPAKEKVFDFSGLDIAGQLRAPQLLYFLDRAAEELERASLERRSFLPEMVRSIEEESL